ncbi:uncharacterized protein TrAtP1_010219 [Trichoderma atroviride]|uniref:uncharacterized protein n=1 Tax=Hypocrea atroviridis TaxID=63577 RepID=UPI0033339C9B|nr:hypothetical protein TrAtP1_010219 [Trichoderma atroviride]
MPVSSCKCAKYECVDGLRAKTELKDSNLYKQQSDASKFKSPGVKDYQPYKILKGAKDDYLDTIEKISDVVAKTSANIRAKAKGGKLDEATEKQFAPFEECNSLIKAARIDDHEPYLIDVTEKYLKLLGIEIKTEILDPPVNPVDSIKNWKTVDWGTTIDEVVKAGKGSKEQMKKLMEDAKKDFYEKPADGSHEG